MDSENGNVKYEEVGSVVCTATRLVKAGFACYGIDYQGHGKSAGLDAYINNFDEIVEDCSNHFSAICEKKENREKARYLLGESMGGAMVLLLHRKKPNYWDGAVLVAPMCKIADDVKPPQAVVSVLNKLCKFIPTWKIIPGQDIIDVAFKEPHIRQEVTIPFIVLHGEEDKVTSKDVSKQLYDSASSSDKTLKLYETMWHGLLYGEPPENIEIVFKDIIDWLEKRVSMDNSRMEMELKHGNDDLRKK
ncbi:hypothetical protein JRO89_XS14G0052200 [Xanthoceras sorbifolium]|uniref:Serine aminopeptidase S33 domain-containing protein n=1 Tax=Xanthoceras sorbifolium TaxID=99658 RepID=A0ABQ8H3X6_9ROSI|nr:hypothetical protein JRO89_XS14G0051900 [Xanthoceras sorbifolium]KAH7548007.1 hypothetical protein JRO89_XS14G0052200 [Xanthoceras sorbifolium]